MPLVMWYSRLQPGVTPEEYEQWVRTVDYAGAEEIESIVIYRVHRVLGPFLEEGIGEYDYVEIAEVTDMDDYMRDLEEHPSAKRIVAEIGDYVESVGSAWGMPTEKDVGD